MILIEEINEYGTVFGYNTDLILVAKQCGNCKELKSVEAFHKTKRTSCGRVSFCKACIKTIHNQKYRKNTKKIVFTKYSNNILVEKQCTKCNLILNLKNFHSHKKGLGGYAEKCKSCVSNDGELYRQTNIEKIQQRSKRYSNKNKEKIKINNRIRRIAVRNQKSFYKNFEKELREFITKNKKDKHHIDHIIPLTHPNICGLHYPQNLTVLSEKENLAKQNKWDGTQDNTNWKTDWRKTLE